MFFWDTGEKSAWSYPAWPPTPSKTVSPLLKQPDGTTMVLKPCRVEAEPTTTKHRFPLHALLLVRAILREPRWEYLLILGSSTVIPPMSDPFRLCEQDPGYTRPCRNLSHGGSEGSQQGQSVLCMDRPCCVLLTGVGSGLQQDLFPPQSVLSGSALECLSLGCRLALSSVCKLHFV